MANQFVYFFGNNKSEGEPSQVKLLGGKGAGLAQMTRLGVSVPAGFTISTEVCKYFYENNHRYPEELKKIVQEKLARVEEIMGANFGDIKNPLLVSVRSGAPVSMPGMMDTVLNLGLNDRTLNGLIKKSKNERFAYDSYRRFVQMYSNVVLGIDLHFFETLLDKKKKERGIELDVDLSAVDLKELVSDYKDLVLEKTSKEFPQDPHEQLWGAVGAVFLSWNSPRAITYRKINKIPAELGTAVNIQAMVFGNLGSDCATGVAFTRNPSTGEVGLFGEYLINAQGEDVVAGIRTPEPISGTSTHSLEKIMPKAYQELCQLGDQLERHYRDMQDVEFTIQSDKVWMLQTRRGKRSAKAAVQIAVDMESEKYISKKEAILRVKPIHLEQLLHPMVDPDAEKEVIGKGLAASPGAATGEVVFSPDKAEKLASENKNVILVRMETSPEDIHGMNVAKGILTARGGMTSHAAVVARGMGKCCVVGCNELHIDYKNEVMQVRDKKVKAGDVITINGSTGEIYLGAVATIDPRLDKTFEKFMTWVDEVKVLKVRANADTPKDATVARNFGAQGIGLCRTEHMFFDSTRIDAMREMILSDSEKERRKALAKLLPMQKRDFVGIFEAMDGYPVTIRLLDPPLHEFLPHNNKDLLELSRRIDMSFLKLKRKAKKMDEFNPMLGFRGCRLGIAYPEIYEMQVQAIMEAACEVKKIKKVKVSPEIMVPIIADAKELEIIRVEADKICKKIIKEKNVQIDYKIGTMIELPRAALTADDVAKQADFFSFGTNDLTQTTFGISRDDSNFFLPNYVDRGIYPADPFVSMDQKGVGRLVELAVELGRKTKPDLKIGICGEHGGDPASVDFCHRSGLNYVSCSPYRVPLARLAAAQAALR